MKHNKYSKNKTKQRKLKSNKIKYDKKYTRILEKLNIKSKIKLN